MQTEVVIIGTDGVARLTPVELPPLTPTRVLVETLLGGVSCGTESDCASGRATYLPRPLIPGYQAVGRVVNAGPQAGHFQPGDLVLTRGGGLWNFACIGGSHARHSVAEAADLIKLDPATRSLESAAYSVLAGVAYEALSRMKLEKGKSLGVFGLGMLGQLAGLIARTLGLRAIGINRSAWKRDRAQSVGFDHVCPPDSEQLARLGEMHFAIDTTGSQAMFDLALRTLAKGGELSLAGYYPEKFSVDFDRCHAQNIALHNPVGFGSWLREIVRLVESGQLNVDPLITHRVAPSQITAFYADLNANHSNYLGAIIDWRAR